MYCSTASHRSGQRWRFALLIGALGLVAACNGGETTLSPTLSILDARDRLDRITAFVENPLIEVRVYTQSLNSFQNILLNGSKGMTPEGLEVPGLLEARGALVEGEEATFCDIAAEVVRGSFVNRVMDFEARDAVTLAEDVSDEHDPRGLFLGHPDELRAIGNGSRLDRQEFGIEGDVVSELWKDITLELIDIIYGLGQECVDAAKEA